MSIKRRLTVGALVAALTVAASPAIASAQDYSTLVTIQAQSDQQPLINTAVPIGTATKRPGFLPKTGDVLLWISPCLMGAGLMLGAVALKDDDEELTPREAGSSAL